MITLILDGSDFLKQGKESVCRSKKRQYCGEAGKRANCQAGVYLSYTTELGWDMIEALHVTQGGRKLAGDFHRAVVVRCRQSAVVSGHWSLVTAFTDQWSLISVHCCPPFPFCTQAVP